MPYNNQNYRNNPNAFYERHGKTPPSQDFHGSIDDLKKNLKPVEVSNWRMEGNQLIGETSFGRVVNNLPTGYIMTGVDDHGKPIFEKIVI
jgi:hypothetical protein